MSKLNAQEKLTSRIDTDVVLADYKIAFTSRQVSLIGRREVMSGKAKFGIFGDGKELAQIGMAKVFKKGDFRSGYYRDQTFMFAKGMLSLEQYFAQLYAHADETADPSSAGRQMNNHFATRTIDQQGQWKNLTQMYNSSADLSPVGSQMPRLVGLAYSSRLYRELVELQVLKQFSNFGNEIVFGTVGNGTCAEGMFWESINAIGVLKSPAVISIYDDGYGISVPNEYALLNQNISDLLQGFQRVAPNKAGYEIVVVPGWDYPGLLEAYRKAENVTRSEHTPTIIHVTDITQPQGHSTSGSHERYKSAERMEWEREFDCISRFRNWILANGISTSEELEALEEHSKEEAETSRIKAWEAYTNPIIEEKKALEKIIEKLLRTSSHRDELSSLKSELESKKAPYRRDLASALHEALIITRDEESKARKILLELDANIWIENNKQYGSHLYSENYDSALKVQEIEPIYSNDPKMVNGFEILNACFDAALERDPRVIIFGQDVGLLGGVNQALRGLQDKYGELRVSDTGIRELTIIGQAIGMAMRGLRPIAEMQYLDYLIYALQIISDDLATLRWRTKGGQKAPAIIRTRGHRLEGIWHSGSQLAGIINLVRGLHVLVPRNMTQAAGFYNTLLKSGEPGLIIEVLNGYRIKEAVPDNIGDFCLPLGIPEIILPGKDITLVTYGAMCRIVMEASQSLVNVGINPEVIDVRTLLPYDRKGIIKESLKKTGRIVFIDEDVPGGASAYMLQKTIEEQEGYYWLDSKPHTVTSKPHRPAYGSDGDYWSKPNKEIVFKTVYGIMNEVAPIKFPGIFSN
jgi:pyruvate/2-oxoglutarate/acetoin dehydrogenase E1 component/TPP-dependent pyruvate/acetoin dehydrogenase alpha subunit